MNVRIVIALAVASLLAACAAREGPKNRSVFLREDVTAASYSGDLAACDRYLPEGGPTGADRTASTATGVIAAGIIGGALVQTAYDDAAKELFDECMYAKGYRLVILPPNYGPPKNPETGTFDRRKAALEMIENNQVDELITWENAKNSGKRELIVAYLRAYPAGSFTTAANKILAGETAATSGVRR